MGFVILHDERRERAVFYCTTSERPLNHEGFMGVDAFEQAEDFLDWEGGDPRRLGDGLDAEIAEWRKVAFDADENFVGYAKGDDDA